MAYSYYSGKNIKVSIRKILWIKVQFSLSFPQSVYTTFSILPKTHNLYTNYYFSLLTEQAYNNFIKTCYNSLMLNMFKKSYFILKNNMIFIHPLLLYLLTFMIFVSFLTNRNIYAVPKIIMLICAVLLCIAMLSGWFYINKYGVLSYNEGDSKEEITIKTIQNFKKFFEGVGADFFKTLGICLIQLVLFAALFMLVSKICISIFGEPKLIYELPKLAKASSQAEILNFVNGISMHDKLVFTAWVLAVNVVASVYNFFGILYFAVNSFEKVNIFKSLLISIKFFFKNIISNFCIIIMMFLLYILLNILSILLGTNSLSFVILIILFTMYLNYYVILVFCFYNDKAKDNSNNGTEFIG